MPPTAATQPASTWPDWLLYFRQFDSYFVLFVAAAVATALATPLYIFAARRFGWVDHPTARKSHGHATATMGGLVVFAAVFAGAIVAMRLDNLVGEMLRSHARYIHGLIACTACMILLGIIDDRRAVRPKVKLLVQTVVAIGAISLGFRIEAVTLPVFDSVVLPTALGAILSLVWIVGVTNAINLSDGLDGLAVGICLLASAVNAIVAIYLGNHYMTVMMVLLAGALLGFLRWNFHPARVFLGDTGSLALGMYLALASLHAAQKAHTVVLILIPLFALGYPIFDTLLAIARRMVRGQPLFSSDRDHIHHRLLDRGRNPSGAAVIIYIASFLVSLLCIAAVTSHYFVLGIGVAGILVMALFSARVLGYLEWGGWIARWSGREETKILHAAAGLVRLKIEHACDEAQLVRALAVIAPEVSCREIVLTHGDRIARWADPGSCGTGVPPVKSQCSPESADTAEPTAFEMTLSEDADVQFAIADAESLDRERRTILEELCRQAGVRLASF